MVTNQTILVADDDQALVDSLRKNIQTSGNSYELKSSNDYQDTLDAVLSAVPDVAVLNIHQPPLKGMRLLKTLYSQGVWFPVIIIADTVSSESSETLSEFGIVDLLKNPFQPSVLAEKIHQIIQSRAQKDLIKNFSLPSILQLIEMDKRTGLLYIEIEGQNGKLFFKEGKVSDIVVKGLSSDEALHQFIHSFYDQREISIEYLDHNKSKKVEMTLMQMVMEASRIKDEKKISAMESSTQPEVVPAKHTVEPAVVGTLLDGFREIDHYIISSPEGEVLKASPPDYDDNLLSSGLLLWNIGYRMGEDLKLNGPSNLICHVKGGNRLIREYEDYIIILELTKLAKYSVFKNKLDQQLQEMTENS